MSSRDINRCSRSRSRSRRSRSPRGTRQCARNRSRSRSNRRKRLSHSRNRNRRSRSRRRSNSSTSSSSSDVVEIEPPIRSDDPKYISCRLFIGRLPPEYTKADLTNYFKRYGPIIDVVVHSKGYGFVQFSNKENAKTAVENESGSIIKGHNVDVKMAADGRRSRGGGATAGGGPRRTAPESDRRPPAPRERSPVRDSYIDRFRDPYRDTVPPPRDDPYFADPYRRPPPPVDDRFDRFDDPFRRRDPYDDLYARDPYFAPPPPTRRIPAPPPIECEIIMLHPQLRGYADKIHDKLKALNVICGILSIPADQNIQKQLEDMSKHGVLYAIVINSQNEVHSSVILNILHGTPQEHRNMPLEDSVALVAKNFEAYLIEKAEKQTNRAVAAPPSATSKPFGYFLPPSSDVSYLLNLLADNRQLTVPEIDKIILYLRDRRVKMQEIEGRQHASDDLYHDSSVKPVQSPVEQEQHELKSKIMSILNGTNTVASPSQSSVRSGSSLYGDYGRATEKVLPSISSHSSANPPMINFDSPSVQQALDNLIQTGPNLLKNIAPGVSQSNINNDGRLSTAPQSSPGYGARPAVQPSPYGGRTGNYALKPESDVGYGGHQSGPAQLYGASAGHGASQPPGMRRY